VDWSPQEYCLFSIYGVSLLRSVLQMYFDDRPSKLISDQPIVDTRPFHWACSFGLLCYGISIAHPILERNQFAMIKNTFPEAGAMSAVLACRWMDFDRWDRYLWMLAPLLWSVRNLTDVNDPPFDSQVDATIAALGLSFFTRTIFAYRSRIPLPSRLSLGDASKEVPLDPLLRFSPQGIGGVQGDPDLLEYEDRDGDTANAFYIVNKDGEAGGGGGDVGEKTATMTGTTTIGSLDSAMGAHNSPLFTDNSVRPTQRRK